jgi:hypothetical protein
MGKDQAVIVLGQGDVNFLGSSGISVGKGL